MGATISDSTNTHKELLSIGSGTIQVDISGEGPGLVIIHSLLTAPESFKHVVPTIAETRKVYQVYLPGFGASSPLDPDSLSIADLADVVSETMIALGCDAQTAVLGNGLGAFIALTLAIRHGQMFDKLIASNCGTGFPEDRKGAFIAMSNMALEGGMSAVADTAIHRIFPADYLRMNPEAPEERRAVLESIDPLAFAAACRALAKLDLSESVMKVENRTLIIVGEIDQTTPPEMGQKVATAIRDANLVAIPECGHCPQLEQPQDLIRHVRNFIDE
jgi:3-oxoadipate enol-lactonase